MYRSKSSKYPVHLASGLLVEIEGPLPRVTLTTPKNFKKKPYKRTGKPSKAEKALVAEFVADQPLAVSEGQVTALAKVLRRSTDDAKKLIEDAKDVLINNTKRYATIHMQATEDALAEGSAKSLDVATKAAQWALENIAEGGVRAVEATVKAESGTKVFVGIKFGGLNTPEVVDAE